MNKVLTKQTAFVQFSMSCHRFPNLSELCHGDLSSKLTKDILPLDFMTRKCNCNKINYINGKCPYGGHCRKCMIVCRVRCKVTGKNYLGQTQQQQKRRMQQHSNKTRRLFRNRESSDSCAHHFSNQFNHEPTPKQMQNINGHEIVWQGNPISVMKTFGTLHSSLCVKKRCQIIKEKFAKNNKIISSCNEIHGTCRHKPRFHRFKISSSSADESCRDKRVKTPRKKRKVRRKGETLLIQWSQQIQTNLF